MGFLAIQYNNYVLFMETEERQKISQDRNLATCYEQVKEKDKMAAFGKAAMYAVISGKGLGNSRIVFDETSKSGFSSKNSLLGNLNTQMKLKDECDRVSKQAFHFKEVVMKRKPVKNIAVINLADAIPERRIRTRVHGEKTFHSFSRKTQNVEIVEYNENKLCSDKSRAVHQLRLKECDCNKESFEHNKRRTEIEVASKQVLQKLYKPEVDSFSIYKNEGSSWFEDGCYQMPLEVNGRQEKLIKMELPILKGEKIKVPGTAAKTANKKLNKTCVPRKWENLKANQTKANGTSTEQTMKNAKSISAAIEVLKKAKNTVCKPELFDSTSKASYSVDQGNELLEEGQTRQKPGSLTNFFLPAIKHNSQTHVQLPSPLIPLNNGYLSRGIDCKRGLFSRTKATVFVDESTGRSHALPGVVTFERSDYNKWSRQNRDLPNF